ncbi:MAG: hypothetical protein IJF17_03790, partial [Thermoguttaceae bacterium]|nr:hypothetical protein [Thermoguttaceae bacterium]
LSALRETFAPWREEKLARWVKIKASSKNTKFPNTMIPKFQFVKISGILRHHVSHGTRFCSIFAHFRVILAPFRLMGAQFPAVCRREAKRYRSCVKFFRLISALVRQFAHDATFSTRSRTRDLRRLRGILCLIFYLKTRNYFHDNEY